ncbi:FG-GAP-like repeat-containing protein [Leeuwenhoekiella sp. H156]|uniref:FG-GAP-like repeat-containing protein n=1 Tax=Leeuwenhoekiella sp. H156 TaxID=3450128 RepID=UPI003FA439BD
MKENYILKSKEANKYLLILVLVALFSSNIILSQQFERVETLVGLGNLEENNSVSVADIDGDYDLDIFVVAKAKDKPGVEKSHSRLFRNDNGKFTDITATSGLVDLLPEDGISDIHPGLGGHKLGSFWGDYDNDGLPDLFLVHYLKVQLFQNRGNGYFVEVTEKSGIDQNTNCFLTGATWTDYDNDGFLDLFINDWGRCDEEILYKNNQNGTFSKIAIGLPNTGSTFNMLPFDFNNDGFKDFYITNDFEKENLLYINQNGSSFEEKAIDYGLNSTIDDMGITVGDFNLDGDFDFLISGINIYALYQNNGSNHFIEKSRENGLISKTSKWSWATRFADFDLDGDEDLFIVNGFVDTDPQTNVYFKNLYKEGQSKFEDRSGEANLDDLSKSLEAVEFDYDNDGDLDIFVACNDRPSFFYENRTINYGQNSAHKWFKVALEGTVSNRNAYGTKVAIKTSGGNYIRYFSGVGMLSQNLIPVHFGLAASDKVDELTIFWPSGLVESFSNLESNVLIKATEGIGFEIIDLAPVPKIFGCTDKNSCNYNPLATINDNSCEYIPSGAISGPEQSGFGKIESYQYNSGIGDQVTWSVESGEIISGQGTNTISVKWGLEESGKVNSSTRAHNCSSLPVSVEVDLSVKNTLEHISVARIWNEALLEAIRNDYARPTVHARNLFHTSVAMFDAWAIYDQEAHPYLMGKKVHGFESKLEPFTPKETLSASIDKAISFAAYRLLTHRFKNSPGGESTLKRFNMIMNQLGYTSYDTSIDYKSGNAAALGNYIAQTIIDYGKQDGARESSNYDNEFYEPVNPALILNKINDENIALSDANRWQPLSFNNFIDQSGNLIRGLTPEFLGAEWGSVKPFSLSDQDKSTFQRDGFIYEVYHDPGSPPYLNENERTPISDAYKWNFSLVSLWSSQLDATDGVLWDISPNTIGNIKIENFPKSVYAYPDFYDLYNGGDISTGHSLNPITGKAYEAQKVPRGDYLRVLAEFWADGPDSETPPGHWFTILNYVNDHPRFERKFEGKGDTLSPLEWDVKSYFILSGAMHDAAIAAWGIKGRYDYIRPISAIRYMCELGQSSDASLPNYNVGGIPLMQGYIELITENDPLAGLNHKNVGKIKLYSWKGHDYIDNPHADVAGVGWILAENWWPYQRISFVTPPFAGYVSGHSTFSRAAAEVLTLMTGSEFFPGGLGEFRANKNEFLVFEKGPSVDLTLQWATYRDASDQCSLSRIWGGIHPPADDIPGKLIGKQVGEEAFNFALPYFTSDHYENNNDGFSVFPNPNTSKVFFVTNSKPTDLFNVYDISGRNLLIEVNFDVTNQTATVVFPNAISVGIYTLKKNNVSKLVIIK